MKPGVKNSALERYLPHAAAATFAIAALPIWIGIQLVDNSWVATGLAVIISLGLTHLLGLLWQQHPGSEDVVFGDLMLWSYLRRLRIQRGVTKHIERLGLGKPSARDKSLTREQQVRLLKRLAVSLEAGDPYLNGHSQRVARHAVMIAKFMKLPRRQREKIKLAGLLHDVGKLYVPPEVLNKPDRLTDEEFEIVKKHAAIGSEIVSRLGDDELTAMVRHHHERIDGTGYPDKRSGSDIPLGARILSVADTFDALTSRRAYRPAQKHKLALGILQKEAGHQLDADAVKAFLRYYTGFRSVGRWFFLTGGFSHAAELAFAWTQRIGLAGIANAAVAGSTAVAIAAAPVVSSNILKKDGGQRIVRDQAAGDAEHSKAAAQSKRQGQDAVKGGVRAKAKSGGSGKGTGRADKAERENGKGKDKEEAADENSSGDSGNGNSGNDNSGSGNSGTDNSGSGNSGTDNSGSGSSDNSGSDGASSGSGSDGSTDTDDSSGPGNGSRNGKDGSTDASDPVLDEPTEDSSGPGNGNGNGNGRNKEASVPPAPSDLLDDVLDPVLDPVIDPAPGNSGHDKKDKLP